MSEPVVEVEVQTITVQADALAAADPGMCAATGVPADHTRTELSHNLSPLVYGIQRTVGLLGLFGIVLAPFIRSAAVRLPIATPLWRQLRKYELAATTAVILGIFGFILGLALRLPALAILGIAAFAVPVAVQIWRRNHWVKVGQVHGGWVKISGCHPRFVEALESREVLLLP